MLWNFAKSAMNCIRIANSFTKVNNLSNTRSIVTSSINNFQATSCLFAEPLRKKKKLDPMVVRLREERKKRRIEKRIRRLEKLSKQLKPISENEIPLKLIDEKSKRLRNLPPFTVAQWNEKMLLEKEWCNYKTQQLKIEMDIVNSMIMSQQRALDELKEESLELYMNAISIDNDLIPQECNGPLYTPPIKNYYRDGEYQDVSIKYEGE